jgi:hypothetical protein
VLVGLTPPPPELVMSTVSSPPPLTAGPHSTHGQLLPTLLPQCWVVYYMMLELPVVFLWVVPQQCIYWRTHCWHVCIHMHLWCVCVCRPRACCSPT